MVDDILKAIDEKAQEQIERILQEKKEAILAMENQYSLTLKAIQENQKKEALKGVAKEIEDFEKELQLKLNFKIQEEKNNLVKEVYEKAKEKVLRLDNNDFKKLIKYLAGYVPKNKKGLIEAGEKTAKALKGLVDSEIKVEDSLNEEGFIFKSHNVEIDLRISQVFSQMQEAANPELIKILFS